MIRLADFRALRDACHHLTVYRPLLHRQPFQNMVRLADTISVQSDMTAERFELLALLVEAQEADTEPGPGLWESYLVDSILRAETSFSERAATVPLEQISVPMTDAARSDLANLRRIYDLGPLVLPSKSEIRTGPDSAPDMARTRVAGGLKARFHSTADWATILEPLAQYHYENGVGELAGYRAFRWSPSEGLVGVSRPDPITLDDLTGYDYQRRMLVANTEQFLAGFPCNNILLYGARGTGKSSLVKALLNAYGERGLRLVEIAREDLEHFPAIVRQLRGRPQRYLLFADDLSYDDSELNYRALKAALEGSVEGRPENVLLYATSNRRHLVKERFSDRDSSDEEIHTQDTTQEKLSLSDRFGLTLSFAPPAQPEYLRMVDLIASRRGLTIDREELHAAAIRWAALHNIPSGRTARQFIDDLQGSLLRQQSEPPHDT